MNLRFALPKQTYKNPTFNINRFSLSLAVYLAVLAFPCSPASHVTAQDVAQPPSTPEETNDSEATSKFKPDPGQTDFDEAVVARIDAKTPEQLEAVASLLESALAKGLSEENQSFAKKMLGSVLLQQSERMTVLMTRVRGRRQIQYRDEALELLNKAVDNDPTLAEAHLLIAQLNLGPDGDHDQIIESTTKAIELLEEDPLKQSAAYLLRAVTQDDDEKKRADLDSAIQASETNLKALQARAALRMSEDDVDGAMADVEKILEIDPTNLLLAQTAVQQLVEMDRVDDALGLITKAIEARPNEGLYRLRAILYRMQNKEDEALADLNKALAMQPRDPASLLQRAEMALGRKDVRSAKKDLRDAIRLAPQIAEADQTIFVRCLIAIEEGRMADAINDMKMLVARDPGNSVRQLQLANLYLQDERPRKAIETLSSILDRDPTNVGVLRSRADAYLSVGEHQNAIDDYERAIKNADDDDLDLPGILNNLAWVLATSPNDDVRNGKRSIELGERAAKLSQYKEAHILSTLAAGYAESGDFEKAIEWSSKAVELGQAEEHAQTEQLQEELDSYKQSKPWREKQEVEENQVPILSPEDLIDT